jgi:uncharacterized membrane protein YdjX (TVP38/TMEM64 family)
MVEFIVMVFVLTISTMLILGILGTGVLLLVRPEFNFGPVISIFSDIISTILGALIGFIAGRGQGRTEAAEEVMVARTEAATAKAEAGAIVKAVQGEQ